MLRHLSACLSLLLSGVALAAAPQPPAVDAHAWLLMDATSGQSIASRNPKERIEPASLTKLMTAYLASALIRDYPEYYKLYSEREYRYNDITQRNRNQLLWLDPNVDGVKTGHTETAGYCLIASARRGGRRLLSVVLGTASERLRIRESQRLLNFGFQSYDALRLYQKGDAIGKLQVRKGRERELKAGAVADLYVTVPKGTADKLQAELVSQQPLIAPLEAGQRVATLRVSHDGKPLAEYPVVALESVAAAGFFARAWDSVRLWFR